jgi:hypothetical protein
MSHFGRYSRWIFLDENPLSDYALVYTCRRPVIEEPRRKTALPMAGAAIYHVRRKEPAASAVATFLLVLFAIAGRRPQ